MQGCLRWTVWQGKAVDIPPCLRETSWKQATQLVEETLLVVAHDVSRSFGRSAPAPAGEFGLDTPSAVWHMPALSHKRTHGYRLLRQGRGAAGPIRGEGAMLR